MTAIYLLSFVLFVGYVGWLATRISRYSLTEWLLTSFLLFTGSVILTGFLLSALYLTSTTPAWAAGVFITATVIGELLRRLVPDRTPFSVRQLLQDRRQLLSRWYWSLRPYVKAIFTVLFVTLAIIAVTNLLLVLFTVPNEWDSMTGHLNRVMQYIQRGSMRHFGGTNWNMDTYPKSVCTLQIYSFLITGRFESAFRLIHHLSYWISIVAVFGIVQRIGSNLTASFFCALGYALLPNFLMQAITTETDIVLTAYLSVLLYMLFTYRQTRDSRYLYLAGMAFGIAYGHKITFTLLLPSVFVIMLYTVFLAPDFGQFFGRVRRLALAIIVGMCIWTLPTGYLKNIEVFGHPIGPPTALKHQSVERAGSLPNLVKQGSRNLVRYAYDHFNLDGIRNLPAGVSLNVQMRRPIVWLEDKFGLRLDEETDFSIMPFAFNRKFAYYNANPYWGVFGFGLIIPLLILTLLGVARSVPHRYLGVAVLLHFAALSYSAPYDPFKGRYFIETGLLGIPFLALLFLSPRVSVDKPGRVAGKAYVGLITVLGCISALLCVFCNIRALPFSWNGHESAFTAGRMQQITVGRPDIYIPYSRFDSIVPPNATVALGTINDDYEYPLYGKDLSRRLITINPFEKGVQPIPKEADYLFFARSVITPQPGDLRLGTDTTLREKMTVPGEDYYLRKLK
ncbi:hypothetical protein GCM10023187_21510 [Nibrella viscosa]|uniref:Glycosyltransferase RgtA/B/C/D-like domain-containing protein n=1 Tax=Nibrella viscosa TaxID=1084524 RepID=A0ABP8KDT6_9BACT